MSQSTLELFRHEWCEVAIDPAVISGQSPAVVPPFLQSTLPSSELEDSTDAASMRARSGMSEINAGHVYLNEQHLMCSVQGQGCMGWYAVYKVKVMWDGMQSLRSRLCGVECSVHKVKVVWDRVQSLRSRLYGVMFRVQESQGRRRRA